MLNTTGVGLTDMLVRTDEGLMPREKRLRAIPPLHRTSMVDHYRDAITRQFKFYVARSHRKYSIPHDPDRACDLQWIYLPKQTAPSLPAPAGPVPRTSIGYASSLSLHQSHVRGIL